MKLLLGFANSLPGFVGRALGCASGLALHSRRALVTIIAVLAITPLASVSAAVMAAPQQTVEFSQGELDQMLAPIALYPDALLSQVLIASTYPLEIIQADRWVRSNKDLKTEDALKFAENKDWDPSVKALVAFPDVLKRMSEDVDWTQRLGDAFLGNEESVMDAVQRLRKRAYATGNLEKAQHIRVENEDNNITIEPAEERVVYVPVYDTRVVYGNWWWADYPPVYWHYPSSYTYVSGFYWGSSVYLGPTYFYSSCQWRDRRVVVIDRRSYYNGNPHFYTGRSIVHYEGARAWQHDPFHRHGVAYYNNNLRETYGSRHESYQNDREYRLQHRDNNVIRDPRVNRGPNDGRDNDNHWNGNRSDWNNGASRNNGNDGTPQRHYDRADQVRERLNRDNNVDSRPLRNDNQPGNTINTSGIRVQTQPQNQPQVTGNSSQTVNRGESGPVRPLLMQHRQMEGSGDMTRGSANGSGGGVDINSNNRVSQERKIVTDDANRRPTFSAPVQRPQEQNISAPQPRVERQDIPRRAEFSPQRSENETRAPQPQNTPRFSREKRDNDK